MCRSGPGAVGMRNTEERPLTTHIDPDPFVVTTKSSPIDQLDGLNPMQRYLVHEFVEDYQDGLMSRRDLLSRVAHIAGGTAAGLALLAALGVSAEEIYAQEATPASQAPSGPQSPLSVAGDDPRVVGADITFPSGDATIMAYEARPAGGASATPDAVDIATPAADVGATPVAGGGTPLVLVCHENRGLTEHIRDVTRRLAVAGYTAVALDLVSREGGTAAITDPSAIPGLLTDGDPNRHVTDFQAAITYYGSDAGVDLARIGMIGFCFGGGITWRMATMTPELTAAIPFYGPPPPLDAVPNIQAAVLGVYSDDPDDFANEGREDLASALIDNGIVADIRVYPGTGHAFHNDTGQRYNQEQALAAWEDSLAWFANYFAA